MAQKPKEAEKSGSDDAAASAVAGALNLGGKAGGKPGSDTSSKITQIREILFGQYQREAEGRFRRNEQNTQRVAEEANERMDRIQSQLEQSLQLAMERIDKRLDDLGRRIDEVEQNAKHDIQNVAQDITSRVNQYDQHLKAELKSHVRFTQTNFDSVRAEMEAAIRGLGESKTGRADLGDYLIEVGMRLRGEPVYADIEAQLKELLAATDDDG